MARTKNLEMRQKILSVAHAAFIEKGYENVLMKDIAVACEISPSLLQHYYSKKEDILVGIVYDITFRVESFCRSIDKGLDDDLPEDLASCIDIGVYYTLFYSLLCNNNLRLLKLYTAVLFNAQLLNKGIRITVQHLPENSQLLRGDVSSYIFNGCLSQLVALYFRGNTLTVPIDSILETALHVYCNFVGLNEEEEIFVLSAIDDIVTEEIEDSLFTSYAEGIAKSDFILLD